jgi:hypothetical protein
MITTSPTLDMIGFLATEFLLLKSNKDYVLVGLLFSRLATYHKHKLSKTIIQA